MRSDRDELGPKDVFLQSLTRCERDPQFFERFYERFTESSPAVRQKFLNTNFSVQRRMLQQSLRLLAAASAGDIEGLRELNARAETHAKSRLDISAPLYDLWLETLLESAAEADAEWTPDIEQAWRLILGTAIQHMLRKYND